MTVNETAHDVPPLPDSEDDVDHPRNLELEATAINQNFAQQVGGVVGWVGVGGLELVVCGGGGFVIVVGWLVVLVCGGGFLVWFGRLAGWLAGWSSSVRCEQGRSSFRRSTNKRRQQQQQQQQRRRQQQRRPSLCRSNTTTTTTTTTTDNDDKQQQRVQILKRPAPGQEAATRKAFNPHPFFNPEEEEEGCEPASVAYRYGFLRVVGRRGVLWEGFVGV